MVKETKPKVTNKIVCKTDKKKVKCKGKKLVRVKKNDKKPLVTKKRGKEICKKCGKDEFKNVIKKGRSAKKKPTKIFIDRKVKPRSKPRKDVQPRGKSAGRGVDAPRGKDRGRGGRGARPPRAPLRAAPPRPSIGGVPAIKREIIDLTEELQGIEARRIAQHIVSNRRARAARVRGGRGMARGRGGRGRARSRSRSRSRSRTQLPASSVSSRVQIPSASPATPIQTRVRIPPAQVKHEKVQRKLSFTRIPGGKDTRYQPGGPLGPESRSTVHQGKKKDMRFYRKAPKSSPKAQSKIQKVKLNLIKKKNVIIRPPRPKPDKPAPPIRISKHKRKPKDEAPPIGLSPSPDLPDEKANTLDSQPGNSISGPPGTPAQYSTEYDESQSSAPRKKGKKKHSSYKMIHFGESVVDK